jgi:hypothetical protein
MLELRPTCEHCNRPLPPDSVEARICSFECTFCSSCVEDVLGNVCPNCGGGFVPRPIRPARAWQGNASLAAHPASTHIVHKPIDPVAHRELRARIGSLTAEAR